MLTDIDRRVARAVACAYALQALEPHERGPSTASHFGNYYIEIMDDLGIDDIDRVMSPEPVFESWRETWAEPCEKCGSPVTEYNTSENPVGGSAAVWKCLACDDLEVIFFDA